MDDEFTAIAGLLDEIIDAYNTDTVTPVADAKRSWVEMDGMYWRNVVHGAKRAKERLDTIRTAFNQSQQMQLF